MTTESTALIVDDEPDIRELLSMTLTQMGLRVIEAENLNSARQLLNMNPVAFCLTDMRLPDGNGLELVEHIQADYPEVPVAVITAHGNMEIAVDALKKGAFDFVSKPVELGRLRQIVQSALELNESTTKSGQHLQDLLGNSPAMDTLRNQIRRVARSQAPVFISGESGSGKELVARAIHYSGPRANGPFIPVNCGAIPSELMESEFFGHKKGSFTGAYQDKQGLFQAADGGTLFLDEVADLPLQMQVKLLRAIQEKSVRPVGSEKEIPTNIRILSATHKNLPQEVANEKFRQDLFYRINVIELLVPALRQRTEDIPELAQHFLREFASEAEVSCPKISREALQALNEYNFPGNVRELENILERAFTLCDGQTIKVHDLQLRDQVPASSNGNSNGFTNISDLCAQQVDCIDDFLEEIEKEILTKTLEKTAWNRTAAAKELGISFRQIRYKLKKLGLDE
ncbi:sigma-54 dependent transcriptional regulator [Porticoccaceae bacterium LTM1]|nr:sigma-54 dependent transcriptional regulator [Porticoccaceae bacterium LTM1]